MIGREKRVLLRHYLEQGIPKAEIARHLKISRRTVYNWIEAGELDRGADSKAVRYGPRPRRPSKLDPYKGLGLPFLAPLEDALRANPSTGSTLVAVRVVVDHRERIGTHALPDAGFRRAAFDGHDHSAQQRHDHPPNYRGLAARTVSCKQNVGSPRQCSTERC